MHLQLPAGLWHGSGFGRSSFFARFFTWKRPDDGHHSGVPCRPYDSGRPRRESLWPADRTSCGLTGKKQGSPCSTCLIECSSAPQRFISTSFARRLIANRGDRYLSRFGNWQNPICLDVSQDLHRSRRPPDLNFVHDLRRA